MRLLPDSLRARLLLVTLAPALVFLVGIIALGYFAARATLEDEIGQRLQESAATAAALLPSGLIARFQPDSTRTHANLLARLQRVAKATGVRGVFLVTPDGTSLVDSRAGAPAPGTPDRDLAADRFELEGAASGIPSASVMYRSREGVPFKRGFAALHHEGKLVAIVGVEGSADTFGALEDLRTYLTGLGLLALLALTITVFGFSRRLTAPLNRLAGAAARIGEGRLDAPVGQARGAAEIRVLARTMEEMRTRLRQRDRELQMMLGGIAHEVRNPLGGMELFVGLLKEDLADRPAETELLSRVDKELGNLKRVVEEFLEFARRQPVEREVVPLGDLLVEVSMLADVPIDCAEADAVMHGDAARLRRLLLNLARNARQAGATRIDVSAHDATSWAIRDDGPGLSADAAEHAFDAFFTTKEKGTGLGLALCRRIAEDHGGQLTLANPGEPGACFVLRLPAG